MAARRHYSSNEKTGQGNVEPVNEIAVDEQQQDRHELADAFSQESEMLAKLQAKEQEVIDLTVRISTTLFNNK